MNPLSPDAAREDPTTNLTKVPVEFMRTDSQADSAAAMSFTYDMNRQDAKSAKNSMRHHRMGFAIEHGPALALAFLGVLGVLAVRSFLKIGDHLHSNP